MLPERSVGIVPGLPWGAAFTTAFANSSTNSGTPSDRGTIRSSSGWVGPVTLRAGGRALLLRSQRAGEMAGDERRLCRGIRSPRAERAISLPAQPASGPGAAITMASTMAFVRETVGCTEFRFGASTRVGVAVANQTLAGFCVGFVELVANHDLLAATSRSCIRQGEDGAGRRDTAQNVFAQRQQPRGGLCGNRARDQYRPAERPA